MSKPSIKFDGADAALMKNVVTTIGETIAEATNCSAFDDNVQVDLEDNQLFDPLLRLWFYHKSPNGGSGSAPSSFREHAKEGLHNLKQVACTKLVDLSQYKRILREQTPQRQKTLKDIPENGSPDNLEFKEHFGDRPSSFPFAMLSLYTPCGFDEESLRKNKEFRLWLNVQPKVNDRSISIQRLVEAAKGQCGLLDVLVGKRNETEQAAQTADIANFQEQPYHCCLYASDSVMKPIDRSAQPPLVANKGVAVECMTVKLAGSKAEYNGVIATDCPPRGCTYADISAAFEVLTGKDLAQHRKEAGFQGDENVKGHDKILLAFSQLRLVYMSLHLETIDGWLKLYHILYTKTGFPEITDDNKAAHEYLIPSSYQEMIIRIIMMHNARIKLRLTHENGQGRTAAFRFSLVCSFPSGKPVTGFTRPIETHLKGYYDRIVNSKHDDPESYLSSNYMKKLSLTVPVMVCIPKLRHEDSIWPSNVTEMLKTKSSKDLFAADQAAPKELYQVLSQVLEALKESKAEIHYLVSKTDDETTMVGKPQPILLKQIIWATVKLVWRYREWNIVKKEFNTQFEDFLRSLLGNEQIKKQQKKKTGEKPDKMVQRLIELRSTCTGCTSLNPLMVTGTYDGDKPLPDGKKDDPELKEFVKTMVATTEPEPCLLFLLFHCNHPDSDFKSCVMAKSLSTKSSAIPRFFALLAYLSVMIFDEDSAIVAHSFVNNNGRGTVELPTYVFQSKIDVEQLSKVSHAMLA